jgi:hypothetical protein
VWVVFCVSVVVYSSSDSVSLSVSLSVSEFIVCLRSSLSSSTFSLHSSAICIDCSGGLLWVTPFIGGRLYLFFLISSIFTSVHFIVVSSCFCRGVLSGSGRCANCFAAEEVSSFTFAWHSRRRALSEFGWFVLLSFP